MKILMINVVCGIRSTGRICTDLATVLEAQGHEVRIAYGREIVPERFKKYAVRIGTDFDIKMHGLKSRLLDGCGFGSRKATEKFIKWVKEYNPDVINLHNIHGYYINIEVLFNYLRTCDKKIIWTLHDCWAFTGHAAYCEAANCEKWKNGCIDCPKRFDYPVSLTDRSKRNWLKKKEIFNGIPKLQIVTPSQWLANLVNQSFLCNYHITVIHNGIDVRVFKPIECSLDTKFNADGRKIILGVASIWDERKGIKDFYELRKLLNPEEYVIVLVGLSKKQITSLPDGIIGIKRTNSVEELVELYSNAYVFVNPTYEDNYPTTNLEAIACGTPVVTYDTGGSGESASIYGIVCKQGNVRRISRIIQNGIDIRENRDLKGMDKSVMINKYIMIMSE